MPGSFFSPEVLRAARTLIRIPASASTMTGDAQKDGRRMGAIQKLAVGPDDAAEMTSHSRSAIYDAMNSKSLRSFKSGKRRLILVKDLESWLNELAKSNSM